MKPLLLPFLISAQLLAGGSGTQAQGQSELPRLAALRVSADLVVDGRLDEACWRDAPTASAFAALATKGRAPAPPEETRCQVLFDEQAVVLGIVCREPRMGELIAQATERDGAIWLDDSVELFLQPGPACYYHFGVNSIGTLYDARIEVLADGTPGDQGKGRLWDGVWEAAVSRGSDAWTVEIRVPFASLDLNPQTPSTWRFNVGRTAARRVEYSAWAPVIRGFHDLSRFGYLDGLDLAFSRFVVDGSGLTIPPLFVGQNRCHFSLPVRGEGRFRVSSRLRQWVPGAAPAPFSPGESVRTEQGVLPVTLVLPVAKDNVLYEALVAITDEAGGVPLLLRAHLLKAPTPFDATLDWAVFYPSDGAVAVTVALTVAPDSARGTLQARLLGHSSPEPRQAEVTLVQPGVSRLALPLADLPSGFYRVEVSADLTGLGRFAKELPFYLTAGPFDAAQTPR